MEIALEGFALLLEGIPLVQEAVALTAVGLGDADGFLEMLLALALQGCGELVALPLQPEQFLLPFLLVPLVLVFALHQVFQLFIGLVKLLLQVVLLLAGVGQLPGQSVVLQG